MNRYLVVTELFLPTRGGTAVWFDEVYRRLGGKATDVVTAAVPGGAEHDDTHPARIHRLDLQRVSWLRPESLLMYLRLFGRTLRLALTRRYTAIHAGRALPEGLVALVVGRLTGHSVLVYVHGEELTSWGNGMKYRVMRFVLRHSDRLIANSRYTRETLCRMDIPPARIALINPGVALERFQPGLDWQSLRTAHPWLGRRPCLLSVGRLSRRKGFDMSVRAVAWLRAAGTEVDYVIVGKGEDDHYLQELARELGVSDRVHLLGAVSEVDLPRWYNACELFLMPNREITGDTEGFGMVFLEAAACGKPAIAGRAGGTEDAVLDGETGLRVDAREERELAAAVAGLLEDSERRQALGDAALARARRDYGWASVAARIDALASHVD